MAEYRFRETDDGQSILEKKVKGQPDTWVEDLKTPTPKFEYATKDYVNDKIKEANPDFKGTFDDMADIEALENVNANDWAYLVTQDENDNDVYNRYRYTIPDGKTQYEWLFEVAIKRDNFTDEEWAAITSGITSEDVAKLEALPTNDELTDTLAEKLEQSDLADVIDTIAIADQTNGDITITYDDGEEEPEENNNQ